MLLLAAFTALAPALLAALRLARQRRRAGAHLYGEALCEAASREVGVADGEMMRQAGWEQQLSSQQGRSSIQQPNASKPACQVSRQWTTTANTLVAHKPGPRAPPELLQVMFHQLSALLALLILIAIAAAAAAAALVIRLAAAAAVVAAAFVI